LKVKVKVKCTLVQALRPCTGRTAHTRSRGIAVLFHNERQYKGMWNRRHAPATLYSGKDPVPIVQESGWAPRAGLDRCRKSRPPLGFDPRTVQPVSSRYTDYATGPILKPTSYVMHHQFNIPQLYVLPTMYLCVLYLSENKQ
jgi:hypothetical protein